MAIVDNFRGTVEQGCSLCRWFGHVKAYPAHWRTHSLGERASWQARRLVLKIWMAIDNPFRG